MDRILKDVNFQGGVNVGGVFSLAYAADLGVLTESVDDLQKNVLGLDTESVWNEVECQTELMHIGKRRKNIQCQVGIDVLEQVNELKGLLQRMADSRAAKRLLNSVIVRGRSRGELGEDGKLQLRMI